MMRAMIDARTTKTMMITVSILLSLPVSRSDVVGSTTVAEINYKNTATAYTCIKLKLIRQEAKH